MNFKEYLLSKIAEEASEIAQIAIKIQVFGEQSLDPRETNGDTNIRKLDKEVCDLVAALDLYTEACNMPYGESLSGITDEESIEYIEMKKSKLIQYFKIHEGITNASN